MGGVPWRDSRVQISQTSKQVVVQRCALTSDRKPAPGPPAQAHPCQSQYVARPESACKTAAEHVTHKTPELLRYSAQISGLC